VGFFVTYARVAKWQTHYLEVVAPARAWRFKSSPAHQDLIVLRMIFVSQLINAVVIDDRQENVGRVKDILIKEREKDGYPEVIGIFVKHRGKEVFIAYKFIEVLGFGEVTLNMAECWENDYELSAGEILLVRDVLDQQIFDVGGIRVVRVNDVELIHVDGKYILVGIDISNRALLRRLGIGNFPIFRRVESQYLDWKNVSFVKAPAGSLQLKMSKAKLKKLHPADIANLIESLNFHQSSQIVQSLDEETAAEVLEEVEPKYKDTLLERMHPKKLAEIMEEMTADQAADVIQDLSEHKRMLVFKKLGVRKAKKIHRLSKYDSDVAGGLMNPAFMAVNKNYSVHHAISSIQEHSDEHSSIYHVFVLDDAGYLHGIISVRTLLLADPKEKVRDLMTKVYKTVGVNTNVEDVARLMTKYNLMSVAVVDKNKVMRGIVAVDDVLRYLLPDA
jgi:magnesium transporter